MYLDLSDLVALILIRIIPKEHTHRVHHSHGFPDIESLLWQKNSHYECCLLAFVKRRLHFTPQVKDKISESDRDTIVEKCKEALSWLEDNPEASKDEYERKQKELEGVCNPVITKLYQGAGGGAPPPPGAGGFSQGGGADSSQSGGPTIEEVD